MNSVRTFVSFALSNGKHGIKTSKNTQLRQLLSCAPLGVAVSGRGAHSQDLTKNIQYISNDKVKLTVDPVTMRLDKQIDRPLCIMMNWLLAQHKHVMKYAALYLEQGFDVVSASCSPWQLMWPMKGSQVRGREREREREGERERGGDSAVSLRRGVGVLLAVAAHVAYEGLPEGERERERERERGGGSAVSLRRGVGVLLAVAAHVAYEGLPGKSEREREGERVRSVDSSVSLVELA
ncbi:unnamed protein product [Plutella xylostella]|uniref:(diamondback moth) hypothetical protein n=1 Tax=Plutella xylostella TaxID=51655 RepID=A0A8S4FSK9_PLUXY|nr:unnamed protein product [Plutella xylostella]